MRGDGDGWVHCTLGHRHWGLFGAAGLLLTDDRRAILQHRAPWTHEGGTWALPGGARDSTESAVQAALREAHEEADLDGSAIAPSGMWVDDHGGWSYTTVIARPLRELAPHAANAESVEVRWWELDEIETLPLHHGLAAAWPVISRPVPRLNLVVPRAMYAKSRHLEEIGIPVERLPADRIDTQLDVIVPSVTTSDPIDPSDPRDAGDAGDAASIIVGRDVTVEWLSELLHVH
jgi:8-oxo-dGTP pyrophosphatase MutT (NUDIX family)